jgi:hypothetical protein
MRKDNSLAVALILVGIGLMIGVFLYKPSPVVMNALDVLPRDRSIYVVRQPTETIYAAVPWGFKTHPPRAGFEKPGMGKLPGGDWGQGRLARPGGGLPGV